MNKFRTSEKPNHLEWEYDDHSMVSVVKDRLLGNSVAILGESTANMAAFYFIVQQLNLLWSQMERLNAEKMQLATPIKSDIPEDKEPV